MVYLIKNKGKILALLLVFCAPARAADLYQPGPFFQKSACGEVIYALDPTTNGHFREYKIQPYGSPPNITDIRVNHDSIVINGRYLNQYGRMLRDLAKEMDLIRQELSQEDPTPAAKAELAKGWANAKKLLDLFNQRYDEFYAANAETIEKINASPSELPDAKGCVAEIQAAGRRASSERQKLLKEVREYWSQALRLPTKAQSTEAEDTAACASAE